MSRLALDAVAVCKYSANPISGRHGSDTTVGSLEMDDRMTDDGGGMLVRERVRVWRVPAHQLPNVARNSTVVLTVDGSPVNYRVREKEAANGGGIFELTIVPA